MVSGIPRKTWFSLLLLPLQLLSSLICVGFLPKQTFSFKNVTCQKNKNENVLQEKKYFEEPFKCTFSFAYKLDVYIPITNRQIILEKFLEEWTSTKTKNKLRRFARLRRCLRRKGQPRRFRTELSLTFWTWFWCGQRKRSLFFAWCV